MSSLKQKKNTKKAKVSQVFKRRGETAKYGGAAAAKLYKMGSCGTAEPRTPPPMTVDEMTPFLWDLVKCLPNLKVLNGKTITQELRSSASHL